LKCIKKLVRLIPYVDTKHNSSDETPEFGSGSPKTINNWDLEKYIIEGSCFLTAASGNYQRGYCAR